MVFQKNKDFLIIMKTSILFFEKQKEDTLTI